MVYVLLIENNLVLNIYNSHEKIIFTSITIFLNLVQI